MAWTAELTGCTGDPARTILWRGSSELKVSLLSYQEIKRRRSLWWIPKARSLLRKCNESCTRPSTSFPRTWAAHSNARVPPGATAVHRALTLSARLTHSRLFPRVEVVHDLEECTKALVVARNAKRRLRDPGHEAVV